MSATSMSSLQNMSEAATTAFTLQIPDIVHSDTIMAKILSHIATNDAFKAVSLSSRRLKQVMDREVHKRVTALLANKAIWSLSIPCEQRVQSELHRLQLKIDERCDWFGIERFSIFNTDRCQQFLEFSRSFDFCYACINSWFVPTKLDGISFNPGNLFSQTVNKSPEKREATLKKFDNASMDSKVKLAGLKDLVNEYDACIKDVATLLARAADVNPYFLICKWLRLNNLISDELLHEANTCIEETATTIIHDATVLDLSFNWQDGRLDLRHTLRSVLVDLFSTKAFGSARDIALIAIDEFGPLNDRTLPQNRAVLNLFRGADKLYKLQGVQDFCVVMNTVEEAQWIEAAKTLSPWVQKAARAGLFLKSLECDDKLLVSSDF